MRLLSTGGALIAGSWVTASLSAEGPERPLVAVRGSTDAYPLNL
jgi:hypothetical protein